MSDFWTARRCTSPATRRPTNDDAALVDVEIPNHDRSSLETLITKGHGIVIEEPEEARLIVA